MLRMRIEDTLANGVENEVRYVADFQALEDLRAVRLDGFRAEAQLSRDLLGGRALHDQLQDLALAGGQFLGSAPFPPGVAVEHILRDPGAQVLLTLRDRADGKLELGCERVLEKISLRP